MHEIVVHESADEELKAAALFYEVREADLGQEFLREVSLSFDRIREHPFAFRTVFNEYRRCVMARFPYSVVYRVEGEKVLVFAVAHLRRHPGYWRDRV